MFNFNKSVIKSAIFTGVLYGWMIPTLGLGQVLKSWLPMEMQITQQWQISKVDGNDSTAMWDFSPEPTEEDDHSEEVVENTKQAKSTKKVRPTPRPKETSKINTQNVITSKSSKSSKKITIQKMTLPTPSRVVSAPKKNKRTTKKRGRKCSPESINIKQTGSRSFTLPKKVIRKYSTDWKAAQQLAHLRWSTKNQERQGVKIHHISCRSPLRLSGLKKGDVVVSVNGHSLQKDADLLKVYGRLLVWKKVELKVQRNQRFITVKYTIV